MCATFWMQFVRSAIQKFCTLNPSIAKMETRYVHAGIPVTYHLVCSSLIQAAKVTRANILKIQNSKHSSSELGSTLYPEAYLHLINIINTCKVYICTEQTAVGLR
jgi:hypothetical protein